MVGFLTSIGKLHQVIKGRLSRQLYPSGANPERVAVEYIGLKIGVLGKPLA
jgi:hypothetical protein